MSGFKGKVGRPREALNHDPMQNDAIAALGALSDEPPLRRGAGNQADDDTSAVPARPTTLAETTNAPVQRTGALSDLGCGDRI